MIAPKVVAEVRRLLAEKKLSRRQIAQLTGISRGSVGAIASGKRPDYELLYAPGAGEWEEPTGAPRRCSGCGGMVSMPCLLCRVRKATAARPRSAPRRETVEMEQPLELDLRPEHHARFEEMRAWPRELADVESVAEH
jgi:transcriptional regulator with XRE-family HTH domain